MSINKQYEHVQHHNVVNACDIKKSKKSSTPILLPSKSNLYFSRLERRFGTAFADNLLQDVDKIWLHSLVPFLRCIFVGRRTGTLYAWLHRQRRNASSQSPSFLCRDEIDFFRCHLPICPVNEPSCKSHAARFRYNVKRGAWSLVEWTICMFNYGVPMYPKNESDYLKLFGKHSITESQQKIVCDFMDSV